MLRSCIMALTVTVIGFVGCILCSQWPISMADGCSTQAGSTGKFGPINISVSCETTTGDSGETDEVDSSSTDSTECFKADGSEVACWYNKYWWSPLYNLYCNVATVEGVRLFV